MLQREREVPVQGERQHRLEEHAATRVLIMFYQAAHCPAREHTRIMRIKRELMIPLFDTGVQRSAVFAERNTEQELFLGGVAQKESPLRFTVQQLLGLVPVHLAPVEGAVGDAEQVRH